MDPSTQNPTGKTEAPAETSQESDLGRVWSAIVDNTAPAQRGWLVQSRPVTYAENTFVIAVPDEFTQARFASKLRTWVEDSLREHFSHPTRLVVTVDPGLAGVITEAADPASEAESQPSPNPQPVAPQGVGPSAPQAPLPMPDQAFTDPGPGARTGAIQNPSVALSTNQPTSWMRNSDSVLNPKYTFDTFVIGASNRFAHAAATAAAEAPGKAYNPLLIYGDSGLGKTHLLHAIGHYVRHLYTGARIRYVSSEEFTNEFINAIRDDSSPRFQRKYRDVDLLLIDDIQFLEGKIQTQEEFFHTFNALHNANKQIVISSDRAPKRLEALEDRLRNRFEWGLLTDVQPPDLETRIAILRKKADADQLTAPPDVLEFIASRIQTNIRELEGALIRVTAFASINKQEVDLTLAEIVLRDLIPEDGEPEVSAGLIIAQTANYFDFSIDELCGPSRTRALVTARHIAMYLCRELTEMSLPQIAQEFGGRDHTTVMNAEKRIRKGLAERRDLFHQVTELTTRVKQQAKAQ